jgi:pimeloyl-ACP methyl ester carboxylesterase
MLYHPHPYRSNYPKLLSRGVSPLEFKSSAGRQTAFYFRPNDGAGLSDRIWVVFGGNGSLALDWLPLATRAQAPGNAFLLIDYPGYGRSEGRPTLANTRAAAEGALEALARWLRVEPRTLEPRLDAIGHSLGAAAALDFAMHHPRMHRIILLAPFTSLREEGAFFIGSTLSHLLRVSYDNRAALRHLAQRQPPPRVTIFHGLQDPLIPPEMGRKLAAEFSGFVTFRGMPEANHDTVVAAAEDEILGIMKEEPREPIAR